MLISEDRRHFWCVVAILFGITSLLLPMAVSANALKVVVQDQNGNAIPEAKLQIGRIPKSSVMWKHRVLS